MPTNTSQGTVFNPEVKDTQDPFYLNLSRPISDLKNYGTATSETLKAVADVGGDAVKVAHTLTEQDLDDKIHSTIDQAREEEKARLNATLFKVSGGKAGEPGEAVADATTLLGESPTAPLPSELQNLGSNLETLESARGNGRFSRTDYAARLDTLAKDLRSRYPGWIEHIDGKFKSITGMDPANAVIAGRLADINSWLTTKKSLGDKLVDELRTSAWIGEVNAPAMIQHLQNGGDPQAVLQWMHEKRADKVVLDQKKIKLELGNVPIEERQRDARDVANTTIQQIVTDEMSILMKSFNYGNKPEDAIQSLSKATPQQIIQFGQQLEATKTKIALRAANDLGKPYASDPSRSTLVDLKEGEIDKIVNDRLAIYNKWSSALVGKDMTMAGYYEAMDKAQHQEIGYKIHHSEMGRRLQAINILEKDVGPASAAIIVPRMLTGQFPEQWDNLQASLKEELVSGIPDAKTGEAPTIKKSIETIYNETMKAPDKEFKGPEDRQKRIKDLNEQMFRQVEALVDPATPDITKKKLAASAFSPAGLGMLAKMEYDQVGPAGVTNGRYSVYNRLWSPEMSQSIRLLGSPYIEMYTQAARSVYQNELLKPEIIKLNKIQEDPDIRITYNDANQSFGVNYGRRINVHEDQFKPEYTKQRGQLVDSSPVSAAKVDSTSAFINRLNTAISTYKEVAGYGEKDMNAFILGSLKELQFDPTISVGGVQGIDKKMIDAIISSRKEEEEKKKNLEKVYRRK